MSRFLFVVLAALLAFASKDAQASLNCAGITQPFMAASPNVSAYLPGENFTITLNCFSTNGKTIRYRHQAGFVPRNPSDPSQHTPILEGRTASMAGAFEGDAQLVVTAEENSGCSSGPACDSETFSRSVWVVKARLAGPAVADVGTAIKIDNDSRADTVQWEISQKPQGSNATLQTIQNFPNSRNFTADMGGTYKIKLTLTALNGTESVEHTVVVGANEAAAVITGPSEANPGQRVDLSGEQSTGTPGPLSYAWEFFIKPNGSQAALVSEGDTAHFTPDLIGLFVVKLTVTNGMGKTATATKAVNSHGVQDITASAPPINIEKNEIGYSQIAVSGDTTGSQIAYTMAAQPANGSAMVSTSGLVTFTPQDDFVGSDSAAVLLTITGNVNKTISVSIPITVSEVVPPSAYAPSIDIGKDEVGHSQIQLTGVKPGSNAAYSISTQGQKGQATVSSSGSIQYTPNSGATGSDQVVVGVAISGEQTANLSVSVPVTITDIPNPPPEDRPDLCPAYKGMKLKLGKLTKALNFKALACHPEKVMSPKGTPIAACAQDMKCKANPVNVTTGAMWHGFSDIFVPGRTPSTYLSFQRMYATRSVGVPGDLGPDWRHNWESRLMIVSLGGDVIWVDENGGPWYFVKEAGILRAPVGLSAKLTEESDHYKLEKQDLTSLIFAKDSGNLLKIREPHGEEITLSYSGGKLASVSTPLAGSLNFARDGAGRIASITRARDNLTYTFQYNADGRLSSYTDFSGLKQEYTYVNDRPGTDAQDLLASIKDEIGRVLRFSYYDNGNAHQQIAPGGATLSFEYGNGTTTFHDIDGTTTVYTFDANYRVLSEEYVDGSTTSTQWSAGGYIKSITNELGKVFQFGYDPQGNMTKMQGPADATPALANYDQVFNLPLSYAPQVGARTEFVIDSEKGDILEVRRPGSSETLRLNFGVDAFGNILSVNNGRATYSHERNSDGLLTRVFDARNPETRTYDSRARLVTRTFQSGRTIQYGYDDYDRITSAVDSHGPDMALTYDGVGRVLTRTISDGATHQKTTFSWDVYDRITAVKNPKNEVTKFTYENSRVLESPSSVIDPMGKTTQLAYDARGRLISTTDAKGALTAYGYDLAGQLTSVTDANGNVTSFTYDGNGRKISETRASVRSAGSSNVAANSITNFTYDAAGRLIKEEKVSAVGGDNRVIEYQYDEFDRLARMILKKGNTVVDDSSYAYESQLDAILLKAAENGVANLGFSHEAAPPFAGTGFSLAAAQSGNPLELLEREFTTIPGITGEIVAITDQAGNTLFTKAYDPAGRLIGVKAGSFKTGISYDGFGRRAKLAHSDGSTQNIRYDLLNRVKSLSWRTKAGPIEEHLNYDASGNVFELSRENARYDMQYDTVNQLTAVKSAALGGGEPYTRSWEYDLLGNRGHDSKRGKGEFLANFLVQDAVSRFLADEDAFGDTAHEKTGQESKSFTYRPDGKISSIQSRDATVNSFYDALGRLVARVTNKGGVVSREAFVHLAEENRYLLGKAANGEVNTQIDGQGALERLAEVGPAGSKGYVTDHLGSVLNSPLAGHEKSYGIWGEVHGKPVEAPITYGWAGYSYLSEVGSWDLKNRIFNPITGRFGSADPIGLYSGDENHYRYVKNSPLTYVDPFGLSRVFFYPDDGKLYVYPGDSDEIQGPPQQFPASNRPKNPQRSAYEPEGYGPAPLGRYKTGAFVETGLDANSSYGSGFIPVKIPMMPPFLKDRTGVGIHAGRANTARGVNYGTLGCVRTTEDALDALRKDPATFIEIVKNRAEKK